MPFSIHRLNRMSPAGALPVYAYDTDGESPTTAGLFNSLASEIKGRTGLMFTSGHATINSLYRLTESGGVVTATWHV